MEKTAEANLKNIAISGTLLKKEYGKDQTCSIIYEIQYTGLKTRIDRFLVKEKAGSKKIDGAIIDVCSMRENSGHYTIVFRIQKNNLKKELLERSYWGE